MVNRLSTPVAGALGFILAAALSAEPGRSQEVDWRNAGGGLFADVEATVSSLAPQAASVDPFAERLASPEQPFAAAIAAAADRHRLDPKLLHALVLVESGYRPTACSSAGACGLTQLMPATAVEVGVQDRLDPSESLRGGAAYLAQQVRRFGDLRLALAAYNAGPNRVARLGRIPDIAETRTYVALVVDCYLALTAGRTVRSARDCAAPERRR